MARRIVRGAEPVHGVDQAETEEVMPQAVDGGAGEPGVVGAGDPLGQRLPRPDVPPAARPAPVEEACFHTGGRPAHLDAWTARLLLARRSDHAGTVSIRAQAREEGGVLPELR